MLDLRSETVPDQCPAGHRWEPDDPIVGWIACWCSRAEDGRHGHSTFRCRECDGAVIVPAHDGPAL